MALKHRVGRLEVHARTAAPAVCPRCGNGPGLPVQVRIIRSEPRASMDQLERGDERPGDRCAVCGWKVVYRMPAPQMERIRA